MTQPTPAGTLDVALAHYRRQATIARQVTDRVQALWRRLDRRDLTGSWDASLGQQIVDVMAVGQLAAAAGADDYVAAIVAAEASPSDPAGDLNPVAFAGHAADGRPLDSLLYLPVITTKRQIAAGQSETEAMLAGQGQLLRMATTETEDAGRTAVGVSMAGNRTIQGYIRLAVPAACPRCAVLAGREYGWNRGFQRHPRCDCIHVPATLTARGRGGRLEVPAAPGLITDARAYFDGLSRSEQDRIFTRAGAEAIRDGADPAQVVNARRGMYTASGGGRELRATREATTRRGLYFQREFRRLQQQGAIPAGASSRGVRLRTPRLMPEEIYEQADSRDEAIRMLKRFGYIV